MALAKSFCFGLLAAAQAEAPPPYVGKWPKDADGKPLPCTGMVTTLQDTQADWPGRCENLQQVSDKAKYTEAECMAVCQGNPECTVWQLTAGDTPDQCYIGLPVAFPSNCWSREGERSFEPKRSQRLQHGQVRVVRNMTGEWVSGLMTVGIVGGNGTENIERCKLKCYSDVNCRFWQFGADGCEMEFKSSNQISGNPTISTTSSQAKTMVRGEIIEHTCIPPTPKKKDNTMVYVLGAILGALFALCLLGLLYYVFCKPEPKPKRTRAVKITKKEEPQPLLQPVTYVTYQPTYAPIAQSVVMAPEVIAQPVMATSSVVMPQAPAPAYGGSVVMPSVASAPIMPAGGSVLAPAPGGSVVMETALR